MRTLDDGLAMALAERGAVLAPLDRALLLASSLGGVPPEEVADLTVDRRDGRLIAARIAAFGTAIVFTAACPACGERMEGTFDLSRLPAPGGGGDAEGLRAPTSRMVAEAVAAGSPAPLLEGCGASREADVNEVETALAAAFPLLDVRFELRCSECESPFAERFDIAAWLWREVQAVADQALGAIDRLARAYGWSEAEILALSPARRRRYLGQVAA